MRKRRNGQSFSRKYRSRRHKILSHECVESAIRCAYRVSLGHVHIVSENNGPVPRRTIQIHTQPQGG